MRRPSLLDTTTLAAVVTVSCFLVASFFSGCILDDVATEGITPPCVRPVEGEGTFTVLYHSPHDPKGTFRNIKGIVVSRFQYHPGNIDLNHFFTSVMSTAMEMSVDCDHIESITPTGN
jgi:hypothetical protein